MNTSVGESWRSQLAGACQPGIIAVRVGRLAMVLTLGLALAACSTLRLGYSQGPNLTYWWLDSHVDFDNGQSARVREDIDGLFAWHRSSELPAYADLLRRWQRMAPLDLTASQACGEFDTVRARFNTVLERSVDPLARLALQLSPAQLDHLERHHRKSNQTFEKDFLQGSPEQRLDRRLERAIERYERLYGPLTPAQQSLVREQLQRSPWDPQRTQAERERRQADQLQTVRRAQANPSAAAQAVRDLMIRITTSPTPGYNTYNQQLVQSGCAQFANLHNSTTPAQRAHAVQTLQTYQDDLRALAGAL
ncbi:hypothetical protein F3K02_20675 [Hydrogenophaga sp. D2P1]|uniref:Lipoprotein n=1 Tax=Hydrogenophaga aromaticivorans TaxID=2610898 RepID=A0A7Y8GZB8_9BURK|nr:DUF6279 family lipoprotein [Hydrogenophaga aromaticivorans]NWF47647.1 hypothetical protein [Hydrogenophaga aromaticivorans]